MFLSVVLFVLFVAGCWLYCLTDAVLTPAAEFRGLHKPVWIAVIAVTFIAGAAAWTVSRRLWRAKYWQVTPVARPAHSGPYYATATDAFLAAEALARHPATRAKNAGHAVPIGPDDDPEFLRELTERIRGEQ